MNQRLKEMFKERITSFRECVYLLTGYKVRVEAAVTWCCVFFFCDSLFFYCQACVKCNANLSSMTKYFILDIMMRLLGDVILLI
jgi:Mitotic checkpoint protein